MRTPKCRKAFHFLTKVSIVPPFGLIRFIYGDTVLSRYNWSLEVVGILPCLIGPLLCLPFYIILCLLFLYNFNLIFVEKTTTLSF
ncbi:hypothetical protein L596_000468 [Steinernema carpocapsae]|uniref:Uncharacterized protein n=1 Tax=Steinernema carpocapsae TaxID=34508 RepID=A0A4U8UIX6_STECR|nr:hypothetical protein L596_000468 [Steinernema carpocapsae]